MQLCVTLSPLSPSHVALRGPGADQGSPVDPQARNSRLRSSLGRYCYSKHPHSNARISPSSIRVKSGEIVTAMRPQAIMEPARIARRIFSIFASSYIIERPVKQ